MIEIENYIAGDVYRFKPRECFSCEMNSHNMVEVAHGTSGGVRSIIGGGKVLGVIGVRCDSPGVVTMWAFWSEELLQDTVNFVRKSKAFIDNIMEQYHPHRMQALVLSDFKQGIRYLEFLGFEKESVFKKYNNRQDYTMMVRFF